MPMFSGARGLTVNNSTFVDQSTKLINNTSHKAQITISDNYERTGLRILLAASTPEASHDSSARYPPPRCHPGTRAEYIQRLTQWGLNADNHPDSIVWVKGPAGTGKSAIAQSCAEALGEKLGATFFFSRPNKRDDPNRFFTSISYQLAVNFDPYGGLLDRKITHNPTIVKRAIPHQFSDLLVTPIHQLKLKGEEFPERVIIVDGLDECANAGAQVDIVKIIAESARTQSTPFLWVFFSRLEPNILAVFDLPEVKLISLPIELEISREIDGDIALYLTDKLVETAQKHGFTLPWPRESEIWALVDYSNGLFACAHAISRFIDDQNSAGPAEQLCAVLDLAKHSTQSASNHPLSGLNSFYTLIMERIPPKQLRTVQWVLLATRMPRVLDAIDNANLLRLSELQFRNACRYLHSVMMVPDDEEPHINFYHASFMDFLEDPTRSKQFCIWSDCAVALFDELLPRFDRVNVTCNSGDYTPGFPLIWTIDEINHIPQNCYVDLVRTFFKLLVSIQSDGWNERLRALIDFDFRKISLLGETWVQDVCIRDLLQKVPLELGLIRPARMKNLVRSALSIWAKEERVSLYVIGRGEKTAFLTSDEDGELIILPTSQQQTQKLLKQMHKNPCVNTSS